MKISFFKRHLPKALIGLGFVVLAVPSLASAQGYDGYCYQRKSNNTATGAVIGALAGAAIGTGSSHRYNRGGNTVAGAAVGAVVGGALGNASVDCHEGRYYSYEESGYYDPPPPPSGYGVVYYESRPRYDGYYTYRERYYGPRYYPAPRSYYYRDRYERRDDRYDRRDREHYHRHRDRW